MLEGALFLAGEGIFSLSLVGHSFGGAVVIQAGTKLRQAITIVTLAMQGYGADAVVSLPPRTSIFLIIA